MIWRGVVVNPADWPYVLAGFGAVLMALVVLFATRGRKKGEKEAPKAEVEERWSLRGERSVTPEDVKKAQEEIRLLDLEREVLSYAIRRLYEAQAEGKISEEERDLLAGRYKERMTEVKEIISRSGSVVALHELEGMQDDLVKLFTDRFDDLNKKIEELRVQLEIKPLIEKPVPSPPPIPSAPPEEKEERAKRRPTPAPRKTEAEERIEKIREEVEKVLQRLGQIETEA